MITLKIGSTGSFVAAARRRMSAWGANSHQTGAWNVHDAAQIKVLQKKWGIAVDGVVGPSTWIHLLRPVPAPKPVPKPPVAHPTPTPKPPAHVPTPTPAPPPPVYLPVHGLDCAWAHPDYVKVRAAGYHFVCRYLSNDPSKNVTREELGRIHAAGMRLVLVWESTGGAAKGGHGLGVLEATKARAQATALGVPANIPIYYAVDFDTAGHPGQLDGYADGWKSVATYALTGAYGGYEAIRYLIDTKRISWAWQTYAWSGGKWDPRAHLRQTQNGVNIPGSTGKWADIDLAVHPLYGAY